MAVNAALGGAIRRREDPRLITGAGRYTDDVHLDGCLHAVFIRSTLASARIAKVDVGVASSMAGVVGVFLARDLAIKDQEFVSLDLMARPPLARDVVRFVGDAIGVVVAETMAQAVDAAAAVVVDYEPLPVVTDPVRALEPGAPVLHPANGTNVASTISLGDDEDPLQGADVVVRGRFVNQRLAPIPLETNSVVVEPDGDGGIRMWTSSQIPFRVRYEVSELVGLPESKVRVITGDVGGGFGAKLATYPEQSVLAATALKLARPVRWFEYRSENMVAMTHGRGQLQEVALGATREGRVVGLDVKVIGDAGAYPGQGAGMPVYTGQMSAGAYDIPKVRFRAQAVATNTTVMSSYRGAGRPEATALIERAMDLLAVELALDPAELRRRNLITGPFPYATPTGVTYDSGDYRRALDMALEAADYEELRRLQATRRERGDRMQLGIGISSYVEVTAVLTPVEFGSVRVEKDGSVVVAAGTTSSGQGHETAFAQIASALLDIPIESVHVIASDTRLIASGDGTYASRSLQLGGSAVRGACISLVEKAREEAARRLEASGEDIERFAGGKFGVRGVPGTALGWRELASEVELVAEEEFFQGDQTFPFGCHLAVVEVDVETGEARLIRHIAIDDCGTILNPMLVEGQVHGGVAQGVGQALYEEFVYDADGMPLTASLIDYTIPSIGEIPFIETLHTETPTPHNPLGAKGIGESGTIGSTPAVQNAVIDAVSHLGVRHIDMPLHPMRVWEAIAKARR
ncbi:MAG TPA: xanthine dehydrogenase family protein molybdopterin-binding subunit [Candidatus Dormibacteraeota bacterium]|nr:xanthine dehydrogenase family protein molybdopterin-binding subunit [Candidatus Dormibacteraeota bacterium]